MNDDNVTRLRLVDVKPAKYEDPIFFLRNLAEEIEKGQHGDVSTVAIALLTDGDEDGSPLVALGGGRNSDFYRCAFAFGAAQLMLLNAMQPKGSI